MKSRSISHFTRTDHGLRVLEPVAIPARGDVLADRYVVRARLGRGATGQVFRAYDRATRTHVALKLMLGRPRNALDRLGREVRHARAVQHPNVCPVFELHEIDGLTFFTMELAGESLRATLASRKRRPMAERMADARAVTAGLAAIHAAGIIHRDLKPENLLRLADGRLVVSDFGLARDVRIRKSNRAGTQDYLAPEVRKGRPPSRRSDVWSLGIVLHEILLGGRPIPDKSPGTTPIEAALAELCRDCTAISPGRRPTAAEVLERLDHWDGETLRQRLRRGGLRPAEALRVGAQVLEALAGLHQRGDVHGTIGPETIFLSRPGGAARLLAPEGQGGDVDGRADVVSVGRVLLECLVGQPPRGQGLGSAANRLEPALRPVLHRMLMAAHGHLPADAGALARELAALAEGRGGSRSPLVTLEGEQGVGSVVAVRSPRRTIPARALAIAASFGAAIQRIAAGTFGIAMQGSGTPSDLAARAADCAVALKAALPAATVAIATGRLRLDARGAAGDAAARALRLSEAGGDDILLDAASAALLSSRYGIRGGEPAALLGECSPVAGPRTVLGRQIPCVGRDREMLTLQAIWQECAVESVARTVLLTAPAGTGKSRLRHELLEHLGREGRPFGLLLGRGDALRAGAPFAMLAPALRAAAGLTGGEAPDVARKRLLAHVSRHVAPDSAVRVAAFVGEIADIPFPDGALPALRAARRDPRLMCDQTLAAWLDLLEAECKGQPVLLVLEDLHWGDAPSVQLVDAALRTLRQRPLMVLAVARPEIDDRFPNLWSERDPQRISLPPLTARSSQKLVQAAADLGEREVRSIIERADGNPFYLEELVRAVGAGTGTRALPDTVIGTVQARFDALGPEVKRVLRAAAVFGQTFRAAGVGKLLDGARDRALNRSLDLLVRKEVLSARQVANDREFSFRHALMQEAAYGMLTPEDRVVGHRLAAEYLESTGEHQALLLVEHHERAGQRSKAAHWCWVGAQQALDANDLNAVIDRVERGIRLGAKGRLLATLRFLESRARNWRGEYAQAESAARAARTSFSSDLGPEAVSELIGALGLQAKFKEVAGICRKLIRSRRSRSLKPWLDCLLRGAINLLSGAHYELVETLLGLIEAHASTLSPEQLARLYNAHAKLQQHGGSLARAFTEFRSALDTFEALGDKRSALEMQVNLGSTLCDLGVLEDAEHFLSAGLEPAERMDLRMLLVGFLVNLTLVRAHQGRFNDARVAGERTMRMAQEQGDRRLEGGASLYLAVASFLAGAPVEAEAHARRAVAVLVEVTALLPAAQAELARALLAQGRGTQAAEFAREAYDAMGALGKVEDREASIYLVHAECLLHLGRQDEARAVLRRALTRLEERCLVIDSAAWRKAFLTRLPDHARTLALAWTVGESSPLLDDEVRTRTAARRPR